MDEVFNAQPKGKELDGWNLYSPQWAKVLIEKWSNERVLALHDKDPYDYALAERVIPSASNMVAEFTVVPQQNNHGQLHVEFENAEGLGAIRLVFDNDSVLKAKNGYRYSGITRYEPGKEYHIEVSIDVKKRFYQVKINGEVKGHDRLLYRPVHEISRVAFRTGDIRRFPDTDSSTDQDFDLKNQGTPVTEAIYYIKSFKTKKR